VRVVVLDNLREGVLKPDIYAPTLNPLYRDVLTHYGAVALPCRVADPDRKGKVESAIAHTQGPSGPALRAARRGASLPRPLGRPLGRHAHPRHHQAPSRGHVPEERPALLPLPVEPFRYYHFGTRTVHLDGCVEVEYAYYAPRPAGSVMTCRSNGTACTSASSTPPPALSCASIAAPRPAPRHAPADQPARTPPTTLTLLAQAARAGAHIARSATRSIAATVPSGSAASWRPRAGEEARPRSVEDACAAALELQVADYRFVRRYLERHPAAPLTLRQVDPLIRDSPTTATSLRGNPRRRSDMNLIELQRALRQLRCSGMATGLETRLLEAQTDTLAR